MSSAGQVLLVDDDRDILDGVDFRLRAAGYETRLACDGQEAIDAAIQYEPDAIVLDVRMPRLDGMAALKRLKQYVPTRSIPVIMLSASLVDQQAALEAGARFFVTKPFSGKNLLAALESAIGEEPHVSGGSAGQSGQGATTAPSALNRPPAPRPPSHTRLNP